MYSSRIAHDTGVGEMEPRTGTISKEVRKSFGVYDLLEDLMKFQWQIGCDSCLCVGGWRREN